MAGRISKGDATPISAGEPVVCSTLAEVHEAVLPVGADVSVTARAVLTDRCMAVARQWLDERGLDAQAVGCERYDDLGALSEIGVRWSVIIGRSVAPDSPDTAPVWSWSDRWRAWAMTFTMLTGGQDGKGAPRRATFAVDESDAPCEVIHLAARRPAAPVVDAATSGTGVQFW